MLKKINLNENYHNEDFDLGHRGYVRSFNGPERLFLAEDINRVFDTSYPAYGSTDYWDGKQYRTIFFYDEDTVRSLAKSSGNESLLPALGIVEGTQVNLPDLVTVENGKAMTTSLKVAEVFGKRHDAVLRDIRNLVGKGVHNFVETPYVHPQNGQEYRMYLMDRDGFSLLVMGFTGDKALDWKLKYIEAFNKMEKALLDQRNNPALPQSYSEALRALADEAEARQALAAENKVLAPKAEYHVGATKDGEEYYLREVARSFGTTHIQLSRFLVSKGVFRTRRFASKSQVCGYKNRNVPKERYVDGGYFTWEVDINGYINKVNYTITQKGVHFIAELLYADGLIDEIPAWANLHEEAA
ncbi:Rha family transcriptional regulator [Desulfovibrio oxyclinae]|uniref:Rha family transcriptional regulator n=1 Tax=Desulfovibrio oxyclinae TaxID=63560 RepID=UPI00037D01E2|nr:Rha family transcriptional regulator [Desulfovibrio oxyclinae]